MVSSSTPTRPCRAPLAGAVFLLALCAALSPGPGRVLSAPLPEDPVEEFRQALKLEQTHPRGSPRVGTEEKLTEEERLALAHREQNLKEKAKTLTTLPDLSRALLLLEWRPPPQPGDIPPTRYELASGGIERGVRKDLVRRFRAGVIARMKTRRADDQIAAASLIGETVSTAGGLEEEHLVLYNDLSDLAGHLVQLSEKSPDPRVRAAAARALSQFPTKPKLVVWALGRLLEPRGEPVLTRRAAAAALATLVEVVSGRENPRGSEPGVMLRETRPVNYRVFAPAQQLAVVEQVVGEAARGLRDPDPAVRRACGNALSECVRTLIDQAPRPRSATGGGPGLEEEEPPPEARKEWSEREEARARKARARLAELRQELRPVLAAFARASGALASAAGDRDPAVRLTARRVIDDLAQLRRLLDDYESSLPKAKGRGARATPAPGRAPVASLGAPVRRASHEEAVPRAVPVSKREWLPPAPAPARLTRGGAAGGDVDESLRRVFEATARRLAREGLFDPDVQARRAAAEALEEMGEVPAPYIPELVRALCDRDPIVRWLVARTLGELAPRQPGVVLRGLVPRLADEDLDVRIGAANAIGRYGEAARPAVPALAAFVSRGDVEARVAVMQALEAVGTDAAPALPAVARALSDEDPRVRAEAARVLGRFGARSAPYVPALRRLAADPDPGVRRAGSAAILSITR